MGLSVNNDRQNGVLSIDQSKYTQSILEKFCMEESNPRAVPMEARLELEKNEGPTVNVPYRELLGSLMYLMLGTRPHIHRLRKTS